MKLTRAEREMIKLNAGLKRICVDSEGNVSGIYENPSNCEAIGMYLNIGYIEDVKRQFLNHYQLTNKDGCVFDKCYAVSKRAASIKFFSEYDKNGFSVDQVSNCYC